MRISNVEVKIQRQNTEKDKITASKLFTSCLFSNVFMRASPFIINYSLFIILSGFCSCENNIDTVNLITAKDKTPQQTEENATYVYTDSARLKFKLQAPLIKNFGGKNPYRECPNGMNVDFFDDSMHVSSHINSNYAIQHETTKIMEADGNVVVINKKGEKLNTEQLFWDANKHTIYTAKFVQIKTTTEILYGDGLESNEDFTNYTITNIRGTVQLNNSGSN